MNPLSASDRPSTTPPGPPERWWGLPQLRAMRRDYLGLAMQRRDAWGDVCYLRIGPERGVDLFHPDLVRQALVDHADALIRWERATDVFSQAMGQSVLVTEGATWQRQRRMLQAGFTPRRVAAWAPLMAEAAQAALDAVDTTAADVDMDALLTRLTLDVILRTMLSEPAAADPALDPDVLAWAVQEASRSGFREMFWPVTLPDWLPLPGKAAKRRALRQLAAFVAALRRRMAARRANDAAPRDDILDMLLGLRDEQTGQALSDQEIVDQCLVTFQAGHETTATALQWWSHLMATHPAAAQRAAAEVDACLGTGPGARAPAAGDAAALPWLMATLKEAMRLYPPAAVLITRRTTRPIELGGYPIPPRSLLRLTPWALHRDARFFPEPEAFRPERFLPEAPSPERGAYAPFGIGPRVCLGQHFALQEMLIVAAMLLQRFMPAPVPGAAPPVPQLAITLRPATPLRLRLIAR